MDWKYYKDNGQKFQYETNQWFLQTFVKGVSLPDHCKVLDIGCGPGNVTRDLLLPLLPENAQVYGVDKCADNIDRAKKYHYHPRITYIQMSAEDLDKIDIKFDLIICMWCLHHVREQTVVWKSMGKKLTSKGNIIALLPCSNDIMNSVADLAENKRYGYTKEEVFQLFAEYLYIRNVHECRNKFEKDVRAALPNFNLAISMDEVTSQYSDQLELYENVQPLNCFKHRMNETEAKKYGEDLVSKIQEYLGFSQDQCFLKQYMFVVKAGKKHKNAMLATSEM